MKQGALTAIRPALGWSRCLALGVWFAAAASGWITHAGNLEQGFLHPPASARPWVYWMWMDGNLSREGLTADLEAMQRASIGGVIIMEVDVGIPKGPVKFMSAEWRQLFKHVVKEAERLGLQITLNAGPGWTGSGGPWVKPEQSMQHIVASAVEVTGPTNFTAMLPRPEPRKPYFGTAGLPAELLKAQNEFYADVAVIAFPTPNGNERVADIDEKALYLRHPFSSKLGVKTHLSAPAEHPAIPPGTAVESSRSVDLTTHLAADGRLAWNVPAGNWTILRFGRTSTGANTRPAPAPGLGLECDKFDKAALDAHFDQFVGALVRDMGPRKRRDAGWTSLHIDSWEMGAQNWTASFREEFRRRRSYDPLRYLPAVTGRIVDSREISERFLWDLRQTSQELVIENHAQHLKELGRRHGFGLSIEPYDMNPTADLNLGAVADVPMCEFWASGFDTAYSCFEAASIAHTGGKRIVAAESFTSGDKERWLFHPGSLKVLGDWAFCSGVNRIVFHRYAHQPWLDRWPGMTMGPYGVHWERTQTWWDMVPAYHEYLARCQFMLRQGQTVADILYLTPEGAPQVFVPPKSAVTGTPPDHREYNFDACSPETLCSRARVRDGKITFPSGSSYRVLVLPEVETMTPALLRKVKELAKSGATIVGSPPRKSPSLSDYPQCDADVQTLAREIWGATDTPGRESIVGKGRVFYTGEATRQASSATTSKLGLQDAKWIWSDEGSPAASAPVGKRYFSTEVELPAGKKVESARFMITADNEFELRINGQRVGSGDNFNVSYEFDVIRFLTSGRNVVSIEAVNGGSSANPAGLIAAAEVRLRGGETLNLRTDRRWKAARDHSDAGQSAKELGPWGMTPWGRVGENEIEPENYASYDALVRLLRKAGVAPDFESESALRYTHRSEGGTDIYFVANPQENEVTTTITFRVNGRQPEFWWADSGRVAPTAVFTQRDGRTSLPLKLDPHGSVFVVFRKPAKAAPSKHGANWDEFVPVQEISGPWEVRFQSNRGAPERITLAELTDWSKHTEEGVKYFSGVASYTKTLVVPAGLLGDGKRLYLDLGKVAVMAEVKLNGKVLGILWKSPYRVDITGAAKVGDNVLEITVANLWVNRLIGDEQLPEDCDRNSNGTLKSWPQWLLDGKPSPAGRIAFTSWRLWKKDDPLQESGLLGPVRLVSASESVAKNAR